MSGGVWRVACFVFLVADVFGLPISISNPGGGLTLAPRPPYLVAIQLTATILLGRNPLTAIQLEGDVRFSLIDTTNNYVFIKAAHRLTINTILTAFDISLGFTVPAVIGNTGFEAGTYFAYSSKAIVRVF